MGNSFFLLILLGLLLTAVILIFKKPIIYAFGASEATFPYADSYITIYLLGSVFVMIGLGMNSFINSQGFARTGMLTVLIGAVLNIILDPVFIFILQLGVRGAALATVISQFVSSVWVLLFLAGRKTILKLKKENFRLRFRLVRQIVTLGLSGFTMSVTNSIVQIACNATLQVYGGDLYVTVMTILNSIREVITMPVTGITNGAQPVLGYNYGAEQYERVKAAIRFMTLACIGYTFIVWGILLLAPHFFIHIFNSSPEIIAKGVPALKLYFFGIFMMSLQFSGQSTYIALNRSRQAIFFSIFRKVVIVLPLTVCLPMLFGLGVNGVFIAEPISNFIGGTACYVTMLLTVYRKLKDSGEQA